MPSNARDVDQRDPRVVGTDNDVAAAAVRILINEERDAVTPARVAADAGYSRATICALAQSHRPDSRRVCTLWRHTSPRRERRGRA